MLEFLYLANLDVYIYIWVFPKIVVFPPKSSILIAGFSIGIPLFLETPIYLIISLYDKNW